MILNALRLAQFTKKKDKLSKINYRPVSILSSISKIYEHVINEQMLEHFSQIFHPFLSAFRKGYSCQSILLRFIEDAKEAIDNKEIVGAIFMDISKAFDCLPKGLLIAKLKAYGFTYFSCELIASYLSNRKQRVKICGSSSDWKHLEKGVPQGSILGPLLFNVFLNDLFYFIQKCSLYNFADDNSLLNAAPDIGSVMTNLKCDTDNCLEWFIENGMEANPNKFQFMIISSQPTPKTVFHITDDIEISSDSKVEVLGILIDDKLTFNDHIKKLCTRAGRQLNALSRISKFLSFNSRKIVFKSFVMSNFAYCPLIWHFCGKKNNAKIEKIQERALRIVCGDYISNYKELMDTLGEKTVLQSRINCILVEVFRSLNHMNPTYIQESVRYKASPYNHRNSSLLLQPLKRTTNFGLRSFSYLAPKLWNDLTNKYDIGDFDMNNFKLFLKEWEGPNYDYISNFYV